MAQSTVELRRDLERTAIAAVVLYAATVVSVLLGSVLFSLGLIRSKKWSAISTACFFVLVCLTTLLGLAEISLSLSLIEINIGHAYAYTAKYNMLTRAELYTGAVKIIIYRGAQIALICACLSPVYRMRLSGDRATGKPDTIAKWFIAALLGALAIVSFGLRCNVLSASLEGNERLRPSYLSRFNRLPTQARVSVQFDFAYTSIAFVATVGALVRVAFITAKASPSAKMGAIWLIVASLCGVTSTVFELGYLADTVSPATGAQRPTHRTSTYTQAILFLQLIFGIWSLVLALFAFWRVEKTAGDVNVWHEKRHSEEDASANAPLEV